MPAFLQPEMNAHHPKPSESDEELQMLKRHILNKEMRSLAELHRIDKYIRSHSEIGVAWDQPLWIRLPQRLVHEEGAQLRPREWGAVFIVASTQYEPPSQEEDISLRLLPCFPSCMKLTEELYVWDVRHKVEVSHSKEGYVGFSRCTYDRACDSCDREQHPVIFGPWYNCSTCTVFDLCDTCMHSGEHGHDPTHTLVLKQYM